jgi:DNA adenine methylase
LADTRRGRDRQRPADYLHDMGEPGDHRRLAEVLRSTAATVLLSGYPSTLYNELYGDWWSMDVPVTVHSSNAATNVRGARVERLWANRDLETGLFAVASAEASA